MSLDISLSQSPCAHCGQTNGRVYDANITHNLAPMAKAAGIYEACWHPTEGTQAKHLAPMLYSGLLWLRANENEARKHDSPNGWGTYDHFVRFVSKYLDACNQFPNATVHAWP